MKVPIVVKIGALTLVSTAFYTYVGQLVPQKEVQPPAETKMSAEMTTADLVNTGKTLLEGKGSCMTCHTIGKTSGPMRFPDLGGIGGRAGSRIPGMDALHYLAQSLYKPNDYIVPGFSAGMPVINKPPIGLTDDEIRAVIAYLETLGGTATVTMQTAIPFAAGGAAPAATDAAAGAQAVAAVPADGAAAVPATAATAPAAGGVARAPAALVSQYRCADCHAEGKQRPSLAALADRREPELLAGLAAHSPTPAQFEQAITLAEARALARYLATQGGGGA